MLERLVAHARFRAAAAREAQPQAALERLASLVPPPLDLAERLRGPGVQLIAEVKRRSPSRGDLRPGIDAGSQAVAYADGGAAALSVLTEPEHFGGSLADLEAARAALRRARYSLPILRKDFLVDAYQVVEARAHGADAVLLIVAALTDRELPALYVEARRWGLSALVEVHDSGDLARALALGPAIVGINSRNLRDLSVDPTIVERLRPLVPAGILVVAESGIGGPADARRLKDLGVQGMLVGEALMRTPTPAALARELVEAGR